MSDIDFDELDREVSKLVGDTDPSTISVSTKSKPNETTTENTTDTSTDDVTAVTRRGRFMDVMHPSSDMATKEETSAASQLSDGAQRQTLEPIEDIQAQPEQNDSELLKSETPQDMPHPTDMPDPIDVHENRQQAEELQNSVLQVETVEPEQQPSIVDETPPNDLFVTDAKVEKRPLGQFSNVDTNPPGVTPEAGSTTDEDDTASFAQYSLPPELEKDLVAIEAGKSPDDILSAEETKQESDDENNNITPQAEQTDTLESEPNSGADTQPDRQISESSAALLASGSIPQQYKLAIKEKAGIKDETSSQLFQAEHYDKSPGKASKHKSKATSAIMWVFIVIGILLLGGVIGYAVFGFVSSQ